MANNRPKIFVAWAAALVLILAACKKSADDAGAAAKPLKPKEAASQLQQAFVTSSNAELQSNAKVASDALRAADYEKAVQSLSAIKSRQNLTFEQGIAVHNSMVALEANLINAIERGDQNAKRAYELLKKTRRN